MVAWLVPSSWACSYVVYLLSNCGSYTACLSAAHESQVLVEDHRPGNRPQVMLLFQPSWSGIIFSSFCLDTPPPYIYVHQLHTSIKFPLPTRLKSTHYSCVAATMHIYVHQKPMQYVIRRHGIPRGRDHRLYSMCLPAQEYPWYGWGSTGAMGENMLHICLLTRIRLVWKALWIEHSYYA